MKLVTFVAGSEPRLGASIGEEIVDLNMACTAYLSEKEERLPNEMAAATIPADLKTFLAKGDDGLQAARAVLGYVAGRQQAGQPLTGPRGERLIYRAGEASLKAPIADPEKVIGIMLNYRDHCLESGFEIPTTIGIFPIFANAIVGPGDNVLIPKISTQIDWEGELVAVIGKTAKYVSVDRALEYVAGYTCGVDVSVRDQQKLDPRYIRGKSADTHAPIGPWIVTRDDIPDPHDLDIELRVSGVVKQSSNTRHLIFKVPELVSFMSQYLTLKPGDMIFTGTPGGVGVHRRPQEWLKAGDRIDLTLEKIGTLTNHCVAEG